MSAQQIAALEEFFFFDLDTQRSRRAEHREARRARRSATQNRKSV